MIPGLPAAQHMTVQEWYEQREAERIARDVIGMIPVRKTPRERHAMTKPKLSRAEVVKAQLKALQAEMAHLARFPEDNFVNGTVLQVVKTYTKSVPIQSWERNDLHPIMEKREVQYTYVLLKANGQWWCTGQNGHQINGADWDRVIEFVDGDTLVDVRTGLSVMTDSDVMRADTGYLSAPTLVDVLGEEKTAKVEEFLANPSVGAQSERPKRSHDQDYIAQVRPTREES